MMRLLFTLYLIIFSGFSISAQKMLILERTNSAKTVKTYIGERLIFRLAGEEDYWYERTITDILPESNSLVLDGYLVKVDDISMIKVHRKRVWRIIGGALFSFGVSLGIATAGAALYQDWEQNYPLLITGSIASGTTGSWLLKRRKLRLGNRHRLRIIEIKFPLPAT